MNRVLRVGPKADPPPRPRRTGRPFWRRDDRESRLLNRWRSTAARNLVDFGGCSTILYGEEDVFAIMKFPMVWPALERGKSAKPASERE